MARAHARCEMAPAGATNVIDSTVTVVITAVLARWPLRSATYSNKAITVDVYRIDLAQRLQKTYLPKIEFDLQLLTFDVHMKFFGRN